MLLYDENAKFIGISVDSLLLLGFDDLDDMLKITKDPADCFAKKVGFIYKFDDFSWIDYAMYGGISKKHVLFITKNSKELELDIKIHELILNQDEQKTHFIVELNKCISDEKTTDNLDIQTNENDKLATELKSMQNQEEIQNIQEIISQISEQTPSLEDENLQAICEERTCEQDDDEKSTEDQEIRQENLEHDENLVGKTDEKIYFIKDCVIKDKLNFEDFEFLKAHALIKKQKHVMLNKHKALNPSVSKEFIEDFFKFANLASENISNASNLQDLEIVHEYANKLKNICEILHIDCLYEALDALMQCDLENLKQASEMFACSLEDAKKHLM